MPEPAAVHLPGKLGFGYLKRRFDGFAPRSFFCALGLPSGRLITRQVFNRSIAIVLEPMHTHGVSGSAYVTDFDIRTQHA